MGREGCPRSRRARWALALTALVLAAAGTLALADSPKRAVFVDATSDDAVGRRLTFELREKIRTSAGFRLVAVSEAEAELAFGIRLVTIDANERDPNLKGTRTIYGYVITSNGYDYPTVFETSGIGTCGSDRVTECTADLVAMLDQVVRSFEESE